MALADAAIVILAGGRATRFPGKLEAELDGLPLLARVYENVRSVAPVVVAGRGDLSAALDARLDCPLVIDRWPDRGPLGGLVSACGALHAARVFAIAGDAPHLTAEVLHTLARAWSDGEEALVPVHGTRREPLAALYDRAALLREGGALLATERSAPMHALLDRLRTRTIAMNAAHFTNVNTADDLIRS